jgi:phage tail-like protein
MSTNNSNNPTINPLSTLETDPIRNFKFLVTFEPKSSDQASWGATFGKLGFVSVSGLSITTEPIAYREGGYNTNVHQIPGVTSFTPITMSKGVMVSGGNDVHAKWMKRLFSVLTPTGGTGVGSNFRVDVQIQVLSHPNPGAFAGSNSPTAASGGPAGQHTSLRFKVYNAWISNLTYSNLDAGANSLMVEELTLVHEGFDVSFSSDYTVAGSAPVFTV